MVNKHLSCFSDKHSRSRDWKKPALFYSLSGFWKNNTAFYSTLHSVLSETSRSFYSFRAITFSVFRNKNLKIRPFLSDSFTFSPLFFCIPYISSLFDGILSPYMLAKSITIEQFVTIIKNRQNKWQIEKYPSDHTCNKTMISCIHLQWGWI